MKNKDPYDILIENKAVDKISGWNFLMLANTIFRDETQVDWGSFAYICNKRELKQLMDQTKCIIDDFDSLNDDIDYGIIFIEGA